VNISTPVLDFATSILTCASIEGVWELHTKKMTEYGFDRLLYLSTNLRTYGEWGDTSDTLVLSNYEREVTDVYVDKGLHKRAAMVSRTEYTPGQYSWRNFLERQEAGELTASEKELSELRTEWGMNAGYTIWFDETNERNRSVIGLGASRELTQDDVDGLWSEKGREIFVLNNLVHLKILQLPGKGSYNSMTARQREVLKWVADGKTIKDIAQIMALRPTTIEKHLRLARQVLGANTTSQAVQKALVHNILNGV
jgi:LuxR family transcriptional regulator